MLCDKKVFLMQRGNSCITLFSVLFQKHTVTGAERKSGPELQSNEPGTKREAKGTC